MGRNQATSNEEIIGAIILPPNINTLNEITYKYFFEVSNKNGHSRTSSSSFSSCTLKASNFALYSSVLAPGIIEEYSWIVLPFMSYANIILVSSESRLKNRTISVLAAAPEHRVCDER